MIDIPLGKALVPVESDDKSVCNKCVLENEICLSCTDIGRLDGKNVIFKLVDYPAKDKAYLGVDIKELVQVLMDKHKDEVLKRLEKEISTIMQNK